MVSATVTILSYSLAAPKWVNEVYFELANVPCNWGLYYYSSDAGEVIQATDTNGDPVGGSVLPTFTATDKAQALSDPTISSADKMTIVNFAASGTGIQWGGQQYVPHTIALPLLETNLVEIHLDRNVDLSAFPSVLQSQAISWPFSVRNVDLRLKVSSTDDLPPMSSENITITDPLGNIQRLVEQNWDASHAIDGNENSYWKCAPQPSAMAIVPFYMDVRSTSGGPQLIDRLDIDPWTTGPSMNIYYSNDDTIPTAFFTSDQQLLLTLTGSTPPSVVSGSGLHFTTTGQSALVPSNAGMRFDITKDWTIGVVYQPDNASGTGAVQVLWQMQTSNGTLYDLRYSPSVGQLQITTTPSGGSVAVLGHIPLTFTAGQTLNLVLGRVVTPSNVLTTTAIPSAGWLLQATVQGADPAAPTFVAYTTTLAGPLAQLSLGSDISTVDTVVGYIRDVWLRQEPFADVVSGAFSHNTRLMVAGIGPPDRARGDYNAVLLGRLTLNPTVQVGPDWNGYELKTWTPVARDFVLTKGILEIPPVPCKYLKLEFSHLVPVTYPVQDEGVTRVIRDYPQWVYAWFADVESHTVSGYTTSYETAFVPTSTITGYNVGYTTTYDASGQSFTGSYVASQSQVDFINSNYGVYLSASGPSDARVYYNTDASNMVYGDFSVAPIFASAAVSVPVTTSYSYTVTDASIIHKRFFTTVRHDYTFRTVTTVQEQAYFVGINEIRAYRVDYSVQDDTPEYIETFGDTKIIASNAMTVDGVGKCYSTAAGQQLITKNLQSFSNIKTVQIAALASEYESQFTNAQMSLVTTDHITDDPGTLRTDITGTIAGGGGANGGRTLQFTRGSNLNEVQLVTIHGAPTGGTFTLTFSGHTTVAIAFNATAATVQTDLAALTNIGTGQVTVTGSAGGPYTVTFVGTLAGLSEPLMTATSSLTGGTTPGVTITRTTSGGPNPYGTKTNSGLYDYILVGAGGVYDISSDAFDTTGPYDIPNALTGSRITAVARYYLPATAQGSYTLNIYASGVLIATSTVTNVPPHTWFEHELTHYTSSGDSDLQVEIVQTNLTVSEPFALNFLTIFQNPLRFELSNDNGTTWYPVTRAINQADAYFTFPTAANQLILRITALRAGAYINAFLIVPYYVSSPFVNRQPMDYIQPVGVNESNALRHVTSKPMFQFWPHPWPQQYSIDQLGVVPTS